MILWTKKAEKQPRSWIIMSYWQQLNLWWVDIVENDGGTYWTVGIIKAQTDGAHLQADDTL